MLTQTIIAEEQKIYHAYQPIYDLTDWQPLGMEGLLRSSQYSNPVEAFSYARKANKLYEFDTGSIKKAILTYESVNHSEKHGKLFLNIFPSTILNSMFPIFLREIIDDSNLDSHQLVFELSELELTSNFEELKKRIFHFRKQGVLIAIDDIGSGYSNFKTIIEIEPDYLKLDRYLSINLPHSPKKQSLIEFFNDYASKYNSQLILEGIETESELAIAKAIGVSYGQGYLLGKPATL
ncbi:EAL domain-containing protein [Anaerobacillus sp. MEB173]|uniref:EAL domain-containing protein n=1 Tax=Anaerobacillus sp. MEB173 TaxID=3383345 RepID=UPI003F8F779E